MRRLITPLAAAALLLAPSAADADGGAVVIRDCLNHGHITGHYSAKQYAQALAELPADVAEYSDCASLIRQAQLAAASGRGAGTGTAGTAGTNTLAGAAPGERASVVTARRTGGRPLRVGGTLVRPGVVALRTSSVFNALPTSLLVALAVLAAAALAVAAQRAWNLVRARR